ncbi:MAG: glycosyltransferase family A protein [bacterium]
MRCSIIVPTYDRLKYLKNCVSSLLSLDYDDDYEIIIVNDASKDGTMEFAENLKNSRIRVLCNEKNLGPAISRNRGVEAAKYDIVAFIDDDCIAEKSWLRELASGFGDEEENNSEKIGIAEKNCSLSSFIKEGTIVDFVFGRTYYIEKEYKGYFPERLVNVKNWPGAGNMAFKKNIFKKLGGFDNKFYYYHNEDSELAIRAVENGFNFKYVENAKARHQKMDWEVKSLLASARNASVWVILKKKYPKNYKIFNPPVFSGFIVNGFDYIYFIILPLLVPFLLIRYFFHKKKDLKIFFAKWPVYLFLRRYYIYKEAIRNRILFL